ncbi:unnamed protein product [Closterium sp. Yama58-4]|nr:unnamed protein product [Closterium sp. Yama58-4]
MLPPFTSVLWVPGENFKVPDWFLSRHKDYKDGRYSQVVFNGLHMKMRHHLERLKTIRSTGKARRGTRVCALVFAPSCQECREVKEKFEKTAEELVGMMVHGVMAWMVCTCMEYMCCPPCAHSLISLSPPSSAHIFPHPNKSLGEWTCMHTDEDATSLAIKYGAKEPCGETLLLPLGDDKEENEPEVSSLHMPGMMRHLHLSVPCQNAISFPIVSLPSPHPLEDVKEENEPEVGSHLRNDDTVTSSTFVQCSKRRAAFSLPCAISHSSVPCQHASSFLTPSHSFASSILLPRPHQNHPSPAHASCNVTASLKALTSAVYALAPDSFVRHITAYSLELFARTNPLQPKSLVHQSKA